jgi:hypothetical protein
MKRSRCIVCRAPAEEGVWLCRACKRSCCRADKFTVPGHMEWAAKRARRAALKERR